MNTLKVLCVGALSFGLSCHFNPLNGVMRESLRGPVQLLLRISPEFMVMSGKFAILSLAAGLPCLFLGHLWGKATFLKVGVFLGLLSAMVSVLNFIVFEKSEPAKTAQLIIASSFGLLYFALGFVTGGLWGVVGRRISTSWRTSAL